MAVSWPDPPLDRSILGWDPVDEFVALVGDWLVQTGQSRDNLEIEAKVGRIVDGSMGARVQLPVRTETVVEMQRGWRFESSMSDAQHRRINTLLNQAVEHGKGGIKYERQNEVDLFFPDHAAGGGGGKIRVTKDAKTFATKAVIMKRRLADLNVFCPNHTLDYRISVNVEEPRGESRRAPRSPSPTFLIQHLAITAEPPTDESDFQREKNRLHYTHQRICVDLTQVHAPHEGGKVRVKLCMPFIANANTSTA